MVFRLINVVVLGFLVLPGCSAGRSNVDLTREIERVRSADNALLQAETQRNLEGAMELIAEDAVLQPPDSPPIVGRDAIRAFYPGWFAQPFSGIYRDSESVVISSSGDLACLIGISHAEVDTGESTLSIPGKYLSIWRKTDSKWLCVAVSWSGNQRAGNRPSNEPGS